MTRAVSVVRDDVTAEVQAAQRAVFLAACKSRGWQMGATDHQPWGGSGAWATSLRRLRVKGGEGLVVVDAIDRLADTEVARVAVLALLRRRGVRLLAALDSIDTGDPIGYRLVTDLLTAPASRSVRTA